MLTRVLPILDIVVSSEGTFPLVRRMVEGAPHPGRRTKKKNGMG